MRELPILFSDQMVEAILDNRKGHTRRIVNPQPIDNTEIDGNFFEGNHKGYVKVDHHPNWREQFAAEFCNYRVGDLLYVRETYYQRGSWQEVPAVKTKGGRVKWQFVPESDSIVFAEPETYRKGRHHKDPYTVAWHKRLPRFMPKKYARIWLQVDDVRVERLQDISQEDARSEGILARPHRPSSEGCTPHADKSLKRDCFCCAFKVLWDKINGLVANWASNPWVWVIKFKVLSTTGMPTKEK